MPTLSPAMTSDAEALAARYADECARTLLAYYRAENSEDGHPDDCRRAWAEHSCATYNFENAFPCCEWRDFAEPALLKAIEENRP